MTMLASIAFSAILYWCVGFNPSFSILFPLSRQVSKINPTYCATHRLYNFMAIPGGNRARVAFFQSSPR